uniref:SAM domain-containing protein n=1 Tax=Globisporangium ultimum (strain ATCC 200006 / CBS 805.95 / DAOM BR144) TaxID=431595 RepID=K3WDU8_GLOUD
MRSAKFKDVGNHHQEDEDMEAPPMSPRVRKRLDNAKENAALFNPAGVHLSSVCTQGEVIQWMSACHPDLIEFGRELELRGYHTLSSIAFLTEDDIDCDIDVAIKQLLLTTLSRLRHEFFRM